MLRLWTEGVFIVLLTLVLVLPVSDAGAADWKFYGSARFATFYI